MCYNENSASQKQPKITRNANVRGNKVNNLIKRAKQNYNKNMLDESTKNATSFWGTLKSIFPTTPKPKLTSTTFKVNEQEISNKETIANGLGQFFSSIATKLLQTLHPIKGFVWNKPKDLPIRTTKNFHFAWSHSQKSVNV